MPSRKPESCGRVASSEEYRLSLEGVTTGCPGPSSTQLGFNLSSRRYPASGRSRDRRGLTHGASETQSFNSTRMESTSALTSPMIWGKQARMDEGWRFRPLSIRLQILGRQWRSRISPRLPPRHLGFVRAIGAAGGQLVREQSQALRATGTHGVRVAKIRSGAAHRIPISLRAVHYAEPVRSG